MSQASEQIAGQIGNPSSSVLVSIMAQLAETTNIEKSAESYLSNLAVDNSTGLNNLINSISSGTKAKIKIPKGNYQFKNSIVMKPYVTLEGVSEESNWTYTGDTRPVQFTFNPDTPMDFIVMHSTNINNYDYSMHVKNIAVFGSANARAAFTLKNLDSSSVEGCFAKDFDYGIEMDGLIHCKIDFNMLFNSRISAIKFKKSNWETTTTSFNDVYVHGGSKAIIADESTVDCLFTNSIFESLSSDSAFTIEGDNRITFIKPYIEAVPNTNGNTNVFALGKNTSGSVGAEIEIFGGYMQAASTTDYRAGLTIFDCDKVESLNVTGFKYTVADKPIKTTINTKSVKFESIIATWLIQYGFEKDYVGIYDRSKVVFENYNANGQFYNDVLTKQTYGIDGFEFVGRSEKTKTTNGYLKIPNSLSYGTLPSTVGDFSNDFMLETEFTWNGETWNTFPGLLSKAETTNYNGWAIWRNKTNATDTTGSLRLVCYNNGVANQGILLLGTVNDGETHKLRLWRIGNTVYGQLDDNAIVSSTVANLLAGLNWSSNASTLVNIGRGISTYSGGVSIHYLKVKNVNGIYEYDFNTNFGKAVAIKANKSPVGTADGTTYDSGVQLPNKKSNTPKGATSNRPNATDAGNGFWWHDTTLGVPVYSDGTNWKRFDTNAVV